MYDENNIFAKILRKEILVIKIMKMSLVYFLMILIR